MNIRTLIGTVAALTGVCALVAAALFPGARLAGVPVAVVGFLVSASMFSAAGKLSTQLAALKGQSVSVQLWGAHPEGAPATAFRVHSVRAFAAGLHLWLEHGPGGTLVHLKVAQPKAMSLTAAEFRITDAAYVEWASRKMPRREDAAALVLRTVDLTAR